MFLMLSFRLVVGRVAAESTLRACLVHVGTAKCGIALSVPICTAFLSLVLLLPIGLVDVAVVELNGPVSRPFVSCQFFGECYTAVLAAFAETAYNKLNCIHGRDFRDVFLLLFGDLEGGSFVFFWTSLMICKPRFQTRGRPKNQSQCNDGLAHLCYFESTLSSPLQCYSSQLRAGWQSLPCASNALANA